MLNLKSEKSRAVLQGLGFIGFRASFLATFSASLAVFHWLFLHSSRGALGGGLSVEGYGFKVKVKDEVAS